MHVTYGEKSLLMGDDVAGVLIEYAADLAVRPVLEAQDEAWPGTS